MPRQLSPYEYNHLKRHGVDPESLPPDSEIPVEYVTGHVEFMRRDFKVVPEVLIPRLETEELVELAVRELVTKTERTSNLVLTDVGTGCGAISISVLHQLAANFNRPLSLTVWMSDISAAAVAVALDNLHQHFPRAALTSSSHHHQASFKLNQLDIKLDLFVSDLLESYPSTPPIDLIVANLPYIPSARIASLDSSVKDFEPHLALDGGPEGLTLIHQLLDQSQTKLAANGSILLEVDYTHQVSELLPSSEWQAELIKDQFWRQRFAKVTRRS